MHRPPPPKCRKCEGPHTEANHKDYYDDSSAERQAYLRGWEHQTIGTEFPKEPRELQEHYDRGVKEAKEERDAKAQTN